MIMINTGVFYKYMSDVNKHVDLFKLTYNPDSTSFFDVEVLPDNTVYKEDGLLRILNDFDLFDVATRKQVKLSEKLNVEMLIETFSKHYSNREFGIRTEKVVDNESN